MDETHHAFIVASFYRLLRDGFGPRGLAAFRLAACTYGEQRGKRMAMRCIADGHPLDYEGYFAYGEYPATEGFFDVEMWTEPGCVHERVTRCPWARTFAEMGLKECGAAYCREIDRAIVRGFSPELTVETARTQHFEGECRFYFRDPAVKKELLDTADALTRDRTDIRRDMNYHCAHVFSVFRHTVHGVFGPKGDEVTQTVTALFRDKYGEDACTQLLKAAEGHFETIE